MALLSMEIIAVGFDRRILAFDAARAILTEELNNGFADAVSHVESAALDKVPVQTGRLQRAIGSRAKPLGAEWLGGVGVKLRGAPYAAGSPDEALDTASYAASVERGAASHTFGPRHGGGKKALWWEGAKHPVRRVRHPGQRGQHFLRDALLDSRGAIKDIILDALKKALKRIKEA